jgi:hypothetical protein
MHESLLLRSASPDDFRNTRGIDTHLFRVYPSA